MRRSKIHGSHTLWQVAGVHSGLRATSERVVAGRTYATPVTIESRGPPTGGESA
ncbi:hypothetical protein APASM_2294 [Actinosynnema pretiosum subsp. pretiosum]|nr:hypothetical protein APASM_2294 [Actinosynnema pretiosum subsp. pretiosum]